MTIYITIDCCIEWFQPCSRVDIQVTQISTLFFSYSILFPAKYFAVKLQAICFQGQGYTWQKFTADLCLFIYLLLLCHVFTRPLLSRIVCNHPPISFDYLLCHIFNALFSWNVPFSSLRLCQHSTYSWIWNMHIWYFKHNQRIAYAFDFSCNFWLNKCLYMFAPS